MHVLRVCKVRRGGHLYYLEAVEKGIEPPGTWLTRGARELGLGAAVEPRHLEALLSGRDPVSEKRLGVGHDRVQVAGFDLTFCAPKSVSILNALAEPDVADQVAAGHREGVIAAVRYSETHTLGVRRSTDTGRAIEAAGGVAACSFEHGLSRAHDPHLHSHVLFPNLARDANGRWSALDGRGIYAHLSTTGAVYHAQLRHSLTRSLGVEWGPLERGRADIEGIGPLERREFSRRAAEIAEYLDVRRAAGSDAAAEQIAQAPSRWARDTAFFATRPSRDLSVSAEALRPDWKKRALEVGLTPSRLDAVLDRVIERDRSNQDDGRDAERALRSEQLLGALGERGTSVRRRDVVRAICHAAPRGSPAHAVERATDDYLRALIPLERPSWIAEGPGVGERGYVPPATMPLPGDSYDHDARRSRDSLRQEEQRRVDELLASLGMKRSLNFGRDTGIELGF